MELLVLKYSLWSCYIPQVPRLGLGLVRVAPEGLGSWLWRGLGVGGAEVAKDMDRTELTEMGHPFPSP